MHRAAGFKSNVHSVLSTTAWREVLTGTTVLGESRHIRTKYLIVDIACVSTINHFTVLG